MGNSRHLHRDAASPGNIAAGAFTMVQLQRATNVVLRHFHWENDTAADGKQSTYSFVINSAATGVQTRDIAVEGSSCEKCGIANSSPVGSTVFST